MKIYYPQCLYRWIANGALALFASCLTLLIFQHQAIANNFKQADCIDFINERPARVSCGFFTLPLDHSSVQSSANDSTPSDLANEGNTAVSTVTIPALIARSTRSLLAKNDSAVLVPGGGGPGASMGFGYTYEPGEFLEPYESLRQAGLDIVIVDQRGAGFSKPRLTCPENILAFKTLLGKKRTIEQELDAFQIAMRDCLHSYEQQGIDVGLFDTRQSSLDFLAIMQALDYQSWSTIATSYATTIAQAMQALQPGAFDRIVLDSPVPLHYQQPMTMERIKNAIAGSIARCTMLARCSRRYPDLANALDSVLAKAATTPYQIKIRIVDEDYNNKVKTAFVDDNTLLNILTTAIYYNDHISELPKVLTQLNKGLPQALNGFTETFWYQATDDTFADGLNMTVHCKERQPLEDNYVAARPGFNNTLSKATRLILQSQVKLCRLWGVGSQPNLLPQLQSDTSTLILAGGLDPVISTEDVENTASYFSDASVEVVAGAGHSVWYQHECARNRVVDFLAGTPDSNISAASCDAAVPGFK